MRQFTINNTNGPDLTFTGELLATAVGHPDDDSPYTKYSLYYTIDNKFVCQVVTHVPIHLYIDEASAAIVDTEKEVVDFFGINRLAKRLYNDCTKLLMGKQIRKELKNGYLNRNYVRI